MRKKRILFVSEASYLSTGYATYSREVLTRLHETGKYDLAEFSIYGQANDPKRKSIPWTNYPNMPDPNNAEENKIYQQDGANQFGKWRFERVCIDFKPDVVCVPPGSLVMTDSGYRPIEDIKINDSVLTHRGRFRPVTKLFQNQHSGKLIKIYANGLKQPLELTPEHPVYVYKKRNQTNQKKSISKIYQDVEPEFVAAKDVKGGDLIICPKILENTIKTHVDICDYLSQYYLDKDEEDIVKRGKCNTVTRNLPLNKDFGKFLGYLISDGCIVDRGVSFCFHREETRFSEDVRQLCKTLFGLDSCTTASKDKKSDVTNCNSTLLSDFLQKFVGRSSIKNFPNIVWTHGNKEFIEGIICGLVRGDGCYQKNTVNLVSVRKYLVHNYRMLCLMLDIPTNIQYKIKRGNNFIKKDSDVFSVDGYGDSATKLHEIVKKWPETKGVPKEPTRSPRSTHIVNDHLVSSVKRVRSTDYLGQVYNIEVEEDNSYVVEQFCVHNCDIRDFWMSSFIQHSPVRKYFNFVWMPTVDAEGQNEEWLDAFQDPEIVLTYSDWAIDELKSRSDSINIKCAATPSASEDYQQTPDKSAHKKGMGINPDWKIIGTVMRNQRRKLFPELFRGFGQYLKETGDTNTYLYCHTSYPDNGWDLPKYMMEEGIMSRTLFTYVCTSCNKVSCHKFSDTVQPCDKCNNLSSKLSSVSNGVDTKTLNAIYNLFDLYIQPANSEGCGIPQIEAGACGVPVVATDYSAMKTVVRKLNGTPLKLRTTHLEMETGCYRALLDIDHMSSIFTSFFKKPEQLRAIEGRKTREAFEKNFSWDRTTKAWEECIEELGYGTWDAPVSACNPEVQIPDLATNQELLEFILLHMLNEPSFINPYPINKLIRDVNFGMFKNNPGGYFYGELSIFNREDYRPINREMIVSMFREKTKNKLFWESARLGNVQFKNEDWLCRR